VGLGHSRLTLEECKIQLLAYALHYKMRNVKQLKKRDFCQERLEVAALTSRRAGMFKCTMLRCCSAFDFLRVATLK
jgi:hypothetical protein